MCVSGARVKRGSKVINYRFAISKAGKDAVFVLIWENSDWCGSAGWVKKSCALWACCRRRWPPAPHCGGRGCVSTGQRTAGVISGPAMHFIRGLTAAKCCSERRIRRKVGRLSSLHNVFLPWRFYQHELTSHPGLGYSSLSVQTAGDADSYDADADRELLCIINVNMQICDSVNNW